MRLPGRVVVPLNSMCSNTCERPAPSQRPSWMLPLIDHDCAETTGTLWSSRTITVRPFSRVVRGTPSGIDGITLLSLVMKSMVSQCITELAWGNSNLVVGLWQIVMAAMPPEFVIYDGQGKQALFAAITVNE